ncbi:MAG: hypothetical protein AABX99_00330 [Nanoarchaeota archaeon]
MKLKDLIHNLGFHEWTKWEYVNKNSCLQMRTCEYDSVHQTRMLHDWNISSQRVSLLERSACTSCKDTSCTPEYLQTACIRCGKPKYNLIAQ